MWFSQSLTISEELAEVFQRQSQEHIPDRNAEPVVDFLVAPIKEDFSKALQPLPQECSHQRIDEHIPEHFLRRVRQRTVEREHTYDAEGGGESTRRAGMTELLLNVSGH